MKKTAPLSQSQYGIYAECVGHENEVYYQLPYIYTMDRSINPERLRDAVQATFNAHPVLFSHIITDENGDARMQLRDPEPLNICIREISDIEFEKPRLLVPMQLNGGDLFRAEILLSPDHVYLFLDIHHILCDGTSQKIILTDIKNAYEGKTLDGESLTLAECSAVESVLRQGEDFQKAREWYLKTFDCSDVDSTLLPDSNSTESVERSLEKTLSVNVKEVEEFGKVNGVFKSNFLTSAYALLLAKTAGEEEAVFNTVYNGRKDTALSHTVGMFVKTFPVYAKFNAETTTLDYLKVMQEQMRGCRDNYLYSYNDLMHEATLNSDIIFVYQAELYDNVDINGSPVSLKRINNSTTGEALNIKVMIVDGKYTVLAEFDSNRYSDEMIRQHLESYDVILNEMLTKEKVSEIGMTSSQQLALLDTFNQTDVALNLEDTIVTRFRRQAAATPDNIAVVYKDKRYTYKEVDEISDRIAAYIIGKGLGKEDVVSVLIPRCEWMAIASLGVSKAGCAYQPLDPSYPAERLNFMMEDASAKMLIADPELREIVAQYTGETLLTSEISDLPAANVNLPQPAPEDLFIMLYTSGSTGTPKGCQLVHRNIAAFCEWYQNKFSLTAGCRITAYASYGFDACMMDLYPALTCGATVYVIPEELRLDLVALNEYFESQQITHAFMTTQVAYQFATSIENHCLHYLLTGGEKLAQLTPPANYTLVNIYGPTECTVCITTFNVTEVMKDIPIGAALDNIKLYVVDKAGRRLPVGAAGELWAAGPQVSRGYLNRPEKTVEVYIPNPFDNSEKYSQVYRTGDIVRYLPDGNIQFVGRKDGQVKIRGFRIELKEVESVIRQFPGIKDATVQAFDEEGGGKFIAAYIVADEQIDIEAMNNFIMDEKPPYMVPAVTMQIEAIPLNQNQKVNKKALPKPEKKAAETVAESNIPMNLLEVELHEMVACIVGTKDFGVTTVLGYVGLTSISAIKLAVQLNKRFGVTVDAKALVKTGTIQSVENEIIKQFLENGVSDSYNPKPSTGNSQLTKAPLSYAQTGVYFECLKDPTSTIYNIPYLLTYPEGTDALQLVDTVKKVAESHPELSVRFDTEGDTIIQTLEGRELIKVPILEMSDAKLVDYKRDFVKPFNLKKSPLCRFEVVKTESGVHLLMDVHHLVFDGGSTDLFIRQINAALEGQEVNLEKYTYFDFVSDQCKAEETEDFKSAQRFFDERLKSCEGASEIPADIPVSDRQGWIGEAVCPADHVRITDFCRKMEITPAHLFYAATAYTVSRYTNNRDVYLCTVSSGRGNLKIADTVGMFVNTLALGLTVEDMTTADFLRAASDTFDETLRHENYPFARIAADYGFRPAIAYAYQVGVLSQYMVHGKAIRQELLELNVPKFKINIKIEDRGVVVQYDDSLYSAELGQALAESIVAVATNMMAQADGKVRKLSIVSEHQEAVLSKLRQTATADAPFRFFHECIHYFAEKQPDHQALVAIDNTYTYREMDELTDRIAVALRERGVRERDRVALLLPRTSRLILSLFGVLKSGAAYIPCDPDYPADRIKLILEDSEARFIITTVDRMDGVPADKAINVEDLLVETGRAPSPQPDITSDDLAYLIYTSGSTGRPKGVMLHHRGICNYLYAHPANVLAHAVLNDASRMLSVTTISFDAALQDIGHCYYNGKTLILATEEQANNPLELAQLINEQQINMVSGTPSRWQTWLTSEDFAESISHIKIVRAGGEKFSDQLLEQLRAITKARIFNCYGPTETTVACNNKELTDAKQVTVGKPQLNVKEFIVDADGNELPVGVVGELYIAGRGVGHGYNNLEDKTKESFIQYNGERAYKSGDYAKWLPDGDVVILGRTDHQIKLRGLRIELGEIENVMLKVDSIQKVVILIRKIGGKEHLCAYYTANRTIAPEEVKAEISKSLTQYMVPTAYLQLEKMPMTPNGKTDVKALPEPILAVTSAYEEAANDTERTFCNIFADILQVDKVGATDNFFELGGTSLIVTRVIIEADKAGVHVAYGDVFANPTPRQLATLVTGETVQTNTGNDVTDFDYGAIDKLLDENTLESFRNGERQPLGHVLLTGATGYLGIHILKELIESDAEDICCLVRGRDLDAAEHRLKTLLFYYFEDTYDELFGNRLRVVLGDVTDDLSAIIKTKIDTVFNCAAVVKHFSEGTEIEDVNIGGAQRCVDFCLGSGARLVHISTASTRGLSVNGVPAADCVYTEQKLYMGQYLGNQYIYSKFMAERVVLQAIAEKGLSAKIMRVGNLSARSTDGEFQANFATNSFMGRIKVYNMLGCFPYSLYEKRVEFSPINEVSHAIILLASTPKPCCVFHPYNDHTQFLGDVLFGLKILDTDIRLVEKEDYDAAMEAAGSDPAKAKSLSSLLAYQDMAHGMKSADVERSNAYTMQVLFRLGFRWSATTWDYINQMLSAIEGLGFFD